MTNDAQKPLSRLEYNKQMMERGVSRSMLNAMSTAEQNLSSSMVDISVKDYEKQIAEASLNNLRRLLPDMNKNFST